MKKIKRNLIYVTLKRLLSLNFHLQIEMEEIEVHLEQFQ